MFRIVLVALTILSACGRPLSEGERTFAATLFADTLDTKPIHVAAFPALTSLTQSRPPRPPVACRERIWPKAEPTEGMVKTYTAAFVTWNRINMADVLYLPDYMSKYPDKMNLAAAMLIGHELTHVWQWQHRDITGYSPQKAMREHQRGKDPYLLELDAEPKFLDFPYEQQASIVEEYICCRALDPDGGRTKRLYGMLSAVMPVSKAPALQSRPETYLPFKGAKTRGICS